jgi:hypothetical protein
VRRLAARIEKLERRSDPQDANRIIRFNPLEMTAEEALRKTGKSGGRYMLVPDYGSVDDWEQAALKQQRELREAANATAQSYVRNATARSTIR